LYFDLVGCNGKKKALSWLNLHFEMGAHAERPTRRVVFFAIVVERLVRLPGTSRSALVVTGMYLRQMVTAMVAIDSQFASPQQGVRYDGLSRNTFARDSISSTHADVTFVFNSLSRNLEESQT